MYKVMRVYTYVYIYIHTYNMYMYVYMYMFVYIHIYTCMDMHVADSLAQLKSCANPEFSCKVPTQGTARMDVVMRRCVRS